MSYGLLLSIWRNRGPQESETCPEPYYELRQTEVAQLAGKNEKTPSTTLPPHPHLPNQAFWKICSAGQRPGGPPVDSWSERGSSSVWPVPRLSSYNDDGPRGLIGQVAARLW